MYLSRVILNDQNRDTMRLLSSPEFVHGAIENSFQGPRLRRLWRVDGLNSQCCLLVLSPDQPDFTRLVEQYGFPSRKDACETRDYTALLNKIQAGQTWRFRLKANPVRAVKEEGKDRGVIMAHVTTQQQKEWLLSKAEQHGFALEMAHFEVVHTQWLRFYKGRGHQVTLRTATFEGFLTVTHPETLKTALLEGIGRAKAYGCGLMTLARPKAHG